MFEPHRGKCIYGGRGKAGSWTMARASLLLGTGRFEHYRHPLRVLCARETQKSISDSVHALLKDQITALGLGALYSVKETYISGPGGTEFIFAGLRHNINNIKSVEACDIVWVEEAVTVSKNSWDTLIPTIRKEVVCADCGKLHPSEIWATWNPELETDDTHVRFVLNTPPDFKVVKLSWRDNPWFPETLRVEKDHLEKTDHQAYLNVWEGECKSAVEGAVYGEEIKQAMADGRICSVPYDRSRPVDTYWDLGFGDTNAIWFIQPYGGWFNCIDYYENSGKTIEHYAIAIQQRGYVHGRAYLPHDGVDAMLHGKLTGSRERSPDMLLRAAGFTVRVVPKTNVTTGINAARTLFPQFRFDKERCNDGLHAIRHYQWGPPSKSGIEKREPLHDWASHGADALRTAAMALKHPEPERKEPEEVGAARRGGPDSWF